MTHAKRRTLWRARVADYEASELSVGDWCRENGITAHQLRYWRRRLETPANSQAAVDAGSGWTCVELVDDGIADQAAQPNAPVKCSETALGDGGVCLRVGAATIDVRRGFDAVLLSEVLRVVVATC
jgi:hypothetical protein